jgi:methionyl-tRNA synthetase
MSFLYNEKDFYLQETRMTLESKTFYVTTPIYYGNGMPHIGHFYSSMIADVIARYHKISGYNMRFTTGIDENSQKSVLKAEEEGLELQLYLDRMAGLHKDTWDKTNIEYTDFIRTTEKRHHDVVQEVLQHCYDKGDIYEGQYEWMYCVGCEAFKKQEDLVYYDDKNGTTLPLEKGVPEGGGILVCPDHLKKPDVISEKNYFFKLSKYQTWIEEFYDANPNFVNPGFRFNEVKAFVERWLEDFSISRETMTFGIKLPFDNTQVTYVWFDALFNYYTSLKHSPHDEGADISNFWLRQDYEKNKIIHVVWKDIIRFHAIFWPAMLASYFDLGTTDANGVIHFSDLDFSKLPNQIVTGWHFTIDGHKMSKSIGNVIDPVEYSEKYSKDLLTLYMLSAFPIGNDWDYDREEAIKLYNAKLANNFWNLVNRVVVLSLKLENQLWEWIADFRNLNWQDYNKYMTESFSEAGENITESYVLLDDAKKHLDTYNLKWALDTLFVLLDGLNKFADATEPWALLKKDPVKAEIVLFIIARRLLMISFYLYPFFPEKISEMYNKFWMNTYAERLESWELEQLKIHAEAFNITEKGEPLFARFDV